jgi:hypothetical protein
VFGGQEGVVLVPVVVFVLGDAAAAAAAGVVDGGGLAADAADVDEQGLVLAEEQRQALGYRLLADAVPAVDVHQRGRGRVHGPAEDIRRRDRAGEGRTTIANDTHWDSLVLPVKILCRVVWFRFEVAGSEIMAETVSMAVRP